MPLNMYAKLLLQSEEHGLLDIEYKIEKFGDLDTLINNGLDLRSAFRGVTILPDELAVENMPRNDTIEALMRRIEIAEDLKNEALEGAERHVARSTQAQQLAEKQTDAQPDEQSTPREESKPDSIERRVADWIGDLLRPVSLPGLGAGLPAAG